MMFKQKGNPPKYVAKIFDLEYAVKASEEEERCKLNPHVKNYAIDWTEKWWLNYFASDWVAVEKIVADCYKKFEPGLDFDILRLRKKLAKLAKESDPNICENE